MRRWTRDHWSGRAPLTRLLAFDMWIVGTAVNVAASFLALVAYVNGLGAGAAMALHFGTTPYNAFLCGCVWRHPERSVSSLAISSLWFALMFVV